MKQLSHVCTKCGHRIDAIPCHDCGGVVGLEPNGNTSCMGCGDNKGSSICPKCNHWDRLKPLRDSKLPPFT